MGTRVEGTEMAIRNFWIKANIDGRKTALEGGPAARDGGFRLQVKMRDAQVAGRIAFPLNIEGRANDDGTLSLIVQAPPGTFNIIEDESGILLRRVVKR